MPMPNTTIEKTTMPHVVFTSVSYVSRGTRPSSCMQRPTATAPRSPVNHMTTCMANVMRARTPPAQVEQRTQHEHVERAAQHAEELRARVHFHLRMRLRRV